MFVTDLKHRWFTFSQVIMKLIVRRKFDITIITFCIIVEEAFIIYEIIINFWRIKIFLQEIIWKIWEIMIEFLVVQIFYSKTLLKLQKVFSIICKFVMKSFLKSSFVSILIIQQTQLLISWLSVSQLTICSIHLVVWHELTDIF